MITDLYCICGLPARVADGGGFYCSKECYHVGQHMYRARARETTWMAKQVGRVAGLREALDRVTPSMQIPVEHQRNSR